jgi:hypothetical protein
MGRITRSARMRPCALRLSVCNNDPETTVFAHAPSIDSGMGYKSPDWWGAYACSTCHDLIDGRRSHPMISQLNVREGLLRGIFETQSIMHEEGLLKLDN